MKNSKASGFLDFFFVIVVFFLVGITLIVSLLVVNTTIDTNLFTGYTEAENVINSSKNTLVSMDNMMLLLIVGLSLFVIVGSALVNNSPAYFFIGLFLLIIAIIVSAISSNAFYVFRSDQLISATAASFPKLTFLWNNFPLYVLFMGIANSISMFVGFKRT